MNENLFKRNELLAEKTIKGLASRNMTGYYAATKEDALAQALSLIPEKSLVTMGGGMSVHEIGLVDALKAGAYDFLDRDEAADKRAAMLAACPDLDSAMKRARNVAAPANIQRFASLNPPCKKAGRCFDCKSPDTICCQFLITRYSMHKDRIHVILVNDALGF